MAFYLSRLIMLGDRLVLTEAGTLRMTRGFGGLFESNSHLQL